MPEWHALFLHGAGGGGWEWNLWEGVWRAHGMDVRAPDLRASAEGVAATRWPDYARQVDDALRVLPRARVLVGASLGGLLAMQAAAEADALIVINPLPPAPWHSRLPAREWPVRVPWSREARLASTRRAMADADEAAALLAFRHWRDESGAVLRTAQAGITVMPPACPCLWVIARGDEDVPPGISRAIAEAWGSKVMEVEGRHVGPLLGRSAAGLAAQAVAWLNTQAIQS